MSKHTGERYDELELASEGKRSQVIDTVQSDEGLRQHSGKSHKTDGVEILRTPQHVQAVQAEWEAFLAHDADDHTIRDQPHFMLQFLAYESKDMEPFVVVVRKGGIRCIAPFYRYRCKIPLHFGTMEIPTAKLTSLRLFGERLIHRKDSSVAENITAVLNAVRPFAKEFDAIWLPEIDVGGDVWDFFQNGNRVREGYRFIELNPDWEEVQMIDLPATFEEYTAGFKARDRSDRRRQMKKLEKGCGGNATLSEFSQLDDVRAFASMANVIRNNSWKAAVWGRDRFNEDFIHFLEAVAQRGWLRAYILNCGERPIAYTYGYMYGGTFMPQEWSFEEDQRSLNPGIGMVLKMLQRVAEETGGCRVLLQPEDNRMKRSLGNTSYQMSHAVLVRNRAVGSRIRFGLHRWVVGQRKRVAAVVKTVRAMRDKRRGASGTTKDS